jgi:hypothetical protein
MSIKVNGFGGKLAQEISRKARIDGRRRPANTGAGTETHPIRVINNLRACRFLGRAESGAFSEFSAYAHIISTTYLQKSAFTLELGAYLVLLFESLGWRLGC